MDTPLATFEPTASGMQSISIIAFIVFAACGIGTFLLLRQKKQGSAKNMNALIAMLLFFVGIIALGTFVFNGLAYQRIGTVTVYEKGIQLGKKQIPFSDLENAKIEEIVQTSFFNPNMVREKTRILFIAEKNGKTYALSSDHYPVDKIMERMRSALQKWEESK